MRFFVARGNASTSQIVRIVRKMPNGAFETEVVGRLDRSTRGIGGTRYMQPESLERNYVAVDYLPLSELLERHSVSIPAQLPKELARRVAEDSVRYVVGGRSGNYVPAGLLTWKERQAETERPPTTAGDDTSDEAPPAWAENMHEKIDAISDRLASVEVALDISSTAGRDPAQEKMTFNGLDSTDEFLSARG